MKKNYVEKKAKKKPSFKRKVNKVEKSWRKPRGRHSKIRRFKKSRGKMPSVGYGSSQRGIHPSGYFEVLVYNVKDLEKINPEKEAARIGGGVGKKKRLEITEYAKNKKIKILNPR